MKCPGRVRNKKGREIDITGIKLNRNGLSGREGTECAPHGGKEAKERNHHSKIQYQKKGKVMVQTNFREIHESTKQNSPKFRR